MQAITNWERASIAGELPKIRYKYNWLCHRRHRKRGNCGATFTYDQFERLVLDAIKVGFCRHCGADLTFDNFSPDHIKCLNQNGSTDIENIQIICHTCNIAKSTTADDIFHTRMNYARNQARKARTASALV